MSDAENRLVTNLETRARNAKTPGDRAAALCLIVIHYARQGHIDNARADLAALRSDPRYAGSAEAGAWMELAKGFVARVNCDYGSALDSAQNAYNTCLEENLTHVRPSCAAAIAEIAFAMSQVEPMANRLEEVFIDALPDDHHARSWACQAMAVALHYVAGFQAAKPWYDRLHRHATAEGDQATLSAMFHNITVMNLSKIRLAHAFDCFDREALERLRFEESTHRFYDHAVNAVSQRDAMTMMKGQIRLLLGQFEEAISIFNDVNAKRLRYSDVPILNADLGTALSSIGAIHESEKFAERSLRLSGNINDPDDHAYVYARLSKIFKNSGSIKQAALLNEKAEGFRNAFSLTCDYWLSVLKKVDSVYDARGVCK